MATTQPKAKPTRPPINPIVADSAMNWRMILPSEAPMALRIPISRVLSDTDIVIVFITDKPPTNREIMAIPKIIEVIEDEFQKTTQLIKEQTDKLKDALTEVVLS